MGNIYSVWQMHNIFVMQVPFSLLLGNLTYGDLIKRIICYSWWQWEIAVVHTLKLNKLYSLKAPFHFCFICEESATEGRLLPFQYVKKELPREVPSLSEALYLTVHYSFFPFIFLMICQAELCLSKHFCLSHLLSLSYRMQVLVMGLSLRNGPDSYS